MEETVKKDGTVNIPVGTETKKATNEEVQAAVKAYLESGKPLTIEHVHKTNVKSFGDHMAELGWDCAKVAVITAVAYGVAYGISYLVGSDQAGDGTGSGE